MNLDAFLADEHVRCHPDTPDIRFLQLRPPIDNSHTLHFYLTPLLIEFDFKMVPMSYEVGNCVRLVETLSCVKRVSSSLIAKIF